MVARKKNSRLSQHFLFKTGIAALGFLLLFLVGNEIFDLAWGSGHWLGRLSFKWALTLTLYVLVGAGLFVTLLFSLYASNRLTSLKELLIEIRDRLGGWRWPLVLLAALFPAYFVFYSPLGALFTGVFLRLLIFMVSILVLAFLLSEKETQLVEWRGTLIAGLVIGALLTLAESFVLVSDYPFALHWSEGNRLWDYSVLFGRARYNYPADQPIFAWIDRGRQALWGLPFLIPNTGIMRKTYCLYYIGQTIIYASRSVGDITGRVDDDRRENLSSAHGNSRTCPHHSRSIQADVCTINQGTR